MNVTAQADLAFVRSLNHDGGRVFARRETGPLNTTFGLSFFTGENSDQVVNVVGINPVTFETTKTWEYREYVAGADARRVATLDAGRGNAASVR